jgi:hypothetical protein
MEYSITGEIAQTANFTLQAGETLWASKGAIVSYSSGIDWDLKIPGGLGGAIRRSLAGEGIALTYIQSYYDKQSLVLCANGWPRAALSLPPGAKTWTLPPPWPGGQAPRSSAAPDCSCRR